MPRHFVRPLPSAPALPLDQGVVTLAFEDELACLPGISQLFARTAGVAA